MHDIVLVSVPYSNNTVPPLGISVLKGVLDSYGFKAKCIDLSMILSKNCQRNNRDFESTQLSLVNPDGALDDFLTNFFSDQVDEILELQPRYVAISVFSFMAHYAAICLATEVRKKNPAVKIVVGGPGIGTPVSPELHKHIKITDAEKLIKYGDVLKKRKLADYPIYGDGEEALLQLLNNDSSVNFDEYKIFDYKKEFPFANFDDYNLYDYSGQLGKGYPQIPVFTSKGCVRNCDFCDVNVVQKKFRFRQGKNVLKELLYLADKYGIRDFNFADSLVNGSLSSMLEWVRELAAYNELNPDKKITWSGSWICRPIGQMKETIYKLLADSGCSSLSIGAESGSNHVLENMDKKTNVESLFYEAEQFQKNGIKFMTLLVVGHWSERWQDFVETLKMLYHLANYVRTGNYIAVSIGATMGITKNTPLEQNKNNQLSYLSYYCWWTSVNPSLTAKERYFRLLLIEKFCNELNLPLMERVLPMAHKTLISEFDSMDQFYKSKVDKQMLHEQNAEYYFDNFDALIKQVEQSFTADIVLSIDIEAFVVNDEPVFEIVHNNNLAYTQKIPEGTKHISVILPFTEQTDIRLKITNKNQFDTLVDKDNNIIKDKYILFRKIQLNGIDLMQDIEFFNSMLEYVEDDQMTCAKQGLWKNNSQLKITFDGSFTTWYHKNSKKNSVFGANIISELTLPTDKTDSFYRQEIVQILRKFQF